jgi:tetratricopeptide (TPR) repeat protein
MIGLERRREMYLRKILLTPLVVAATVMALVVSSSFADEAPVNSEIYGAWNALNLEQGGLKANLILIIQENQVVARNTCTYGEYKVVAQTSSPAVITPTEIRILKSNLAMEEYSPGFLQCKASITAANMQYQLRDGKLLLKVPEQGETVELTRAGGQSKATAKSQASKPEVHYTNRGTTYSKKGNYEEAIREYDKAIEVNPSYTVAYYNRSVAYTKTGQYDRAINDCNKVLQLDPKHANSYYTRGVSYWHLGSKNQAIKDLQAAANLKHKAAQNYLTSMGIRW